ncbi:MAG: response regulator [Syntrophales bacterium]|nr:response regulator [Syntrophales bacterium]MDD5531434.1 response regulator [Syntrophales bacterium]
MEMERDPKIDTGTADPGDGGYILVVDDDPESLEFMADVLRDSGYEVETAASGDEAMTKELKGVPDLILIDFLMPRVDGIELTRRIRTLPGFSLNKIIIVSGVDRREGAVSALESGADDFIAKPFDPKELTARVRNQIRIKRIEDKIMAGNEELRRTTAVSEEKTGALQWQMETLKKERDDLALKNAKLESINRRLTRKKKARKTGIWLVIILLASALAAGMVFGVGEIVKSFTKIRDWGYQPMDLKRHIDANLPKPERR